MYIDTHCHLNFKAFENDWQDVLQESLREQVELIIVGTDRVTSAKAVEMARKYSGVWATVGLHPIHATDRDWRSEVQHIRALTKEKKVVAIGEIGLDYYRIPTTTSDVDQDTSDVKKIKKDQETIFRFFLDIAAEVQKPLMLHCRDAEEEFLKILESYNGYKGSKRDKDVKGDKPLQPLKPLSRLQHVLRGQWHCFGGTLEQAQRAIKLGLNIGFTGLITYNNQWDEIIRELPLDRIMAETDAPYLTPVPYRGQRNEPKYVKEVVKKIAELKHVSIAETEKQIYHNALTVYRLA